MKKLLYFFELSILCLFISIPNLSHSQNDKPHFNFVVSIQEPASHEYNVDLEISNWQKDSIVLKMPQWMPGYYQIMNYGKTVNNISATGEDGSNIPIETINDHTWLVKPAKNQTFNVNYSIITNRQFVANSYVDSSHAYIIPANTFIYSENILKNAVSVKLNFTNDWDKIATGLTASKENDHEFIASDFDVLYDCPILIGKLEELPAFKVGGIEHRFIGYNIGSFDKELFMDNLAKIVKASVDVIGDIPFNQYTFIGIGPGRGGIEHLNNTTISFDGNQLKSPEAIIRMMNFIAHEYFHHYNVKRIRPYELGPFDYEFGNRTNLLWISEGLSVYYEYMIVRRAGLMNNATLLSHFEKNINAHENNPGKLHQSLQQASYNTWSDGPFGNSGNEPEKSISYYDKGPIIGLLLDFEIRNATSNEKSLDDVMKLLYWKYYKKEGRGFTEAEFQQVCEQMAGKSLGQFFEYIYTTKEIDYDTYLSYAGLSIQKKEMDTINPKFHYTINKIESPSALQLGILNSWLGN